MHRYKEWNEGMKNKGDKNEEERVKERAGIY